VIGWRLLWGYGRGGVPMVILWWFGSSVEIGGGCGQPEVWGESEGRSFYTFCLGRFTTLLDPSASGIAWVNSAQATPSAPYRFHSPHKGLRATFGVLSLIGSVIERYHAHESPTQWAGGYGVASHLESCTVKWVDTCESESLVFRYWQKPEA